MFASCPKPSLNESRASTSSSDIEDTCNQTPTFKKPIATVIKRKRAVNSDNEFEDVDFNKSWKEVLGSPPPIGTTKVG